MAISQFAWLGWTWYERNMTSKAATLEIQPKDAAKLGGFLKAFVSAVDAASKRMQRDQVEIDRLKAETRAMLTEMKALR